jgi:hypothetical protein
MRRNRCLRDFLQKLRARARMPGTNNIQVDDCGQIARVGPTRVRHTDVLEICIVDAIDDRIRDRIGGYLCDIWLVWDSETLNFRGFSTSSLRSGRRGRRFKSCRPEFLFAQIAYLNALTAGFEHSVPLLRSRPKKRWSRIDVRSGFQKILAIGLELWGNCEECREFDPPQSCESRTLARLMELP